MPLYLRRRCDHYPDDYAQKRFTGDGYVVLCGNLVAGSAEPISGGPSDGRWSWGASFRSSGHASGGTVETLDEAKTRIAVAFRRNLASVGLAERRGAPAGPPVYDPPPPNDHGQEPTRDRWFDRDHPRASAQLAAAWAEWIDWAGLEQREPLRQGKPVYSLC